MLQKNSAFIFIFAALGFLLPSISFASPLSSAQASAILGLLQAFNVDRATVARVAQILAATSTPSSGGGTAASDPPPVSAPHVPPTGSTYSSSNVGYDLSYNTTAYPTIPFGFGVVGATGGKAFVHSSRIVSEYSWAKFGTDRPTMYMNLNAPYGSTVAGRVSTPKLCPPDALNTASGGATSTEPNACDGYNYGYNAALDAYTYANGNSVSSPLWWLDIEEANSWSTDTSVNDATIQGAIDFLNTKNIRVGIYSVPRMWQTIAGSSFVPAQTLGGNAQPVPTWLPIGITNLVTAINTCSGGTSFISSSPIWLVQYEANATAIDQNIAC